MLKRHEIQVLRRAGHSQIEAAKLAGVSLGSVRRVEREPDVTQIDSGPERERRGIGRPAKAEPFRPLVAQVLAQEPELLVGRDSASRETGGLHRREDRAVRVGQRAAADDGAAAGAVRRAGRGVFATRLWPGGGALPRRDPQARALFCVATRSTRDGSRSRSFPTSAPRRWCGRSSITSRPSEAFLCWPSSIDPRRSR